MIGEEVFYHLLCKECNYYQRILEITTTEHEVLERGRPLKDVTQLMKQKKVLLACIEELDGTLKPMKKDWHKTKRTNSPFTEKILERLEELDTLLRETLEIDEANQKLFQKKLLQLREKANGNHRKTLNGCG